MSCRLFGTKLCRCLTPFFQKAFPQILLHSDTVALLHWEPLMQGARGFPGRWHRLSFVFWAVSCSQTGRGASAGSSAVGGQKQRTAPLSHTLPGVGTIQLAEKTWPREIKAYPVLNQTPAMMSERRTPIWAAEKRRFRQRFLLVLKQAALGRAGRSRDGVAPYSPSIQLPWNCAAFLLLNPSFQLWDHAIMILQGKPKGLF